MCMCEDISICKSSVYLTVTHACSVSRPHTHYAHNSRSPAWCVTVFICQCLGMSIVSCWSSDWLILRSCRSVHVLQCVHSHAPQSAHIHFLWSVPVCSPQPVHIHSLQIVHEPRLGSPARVVSLACSIKDGEGQTGILHLAFVVLVLLTSTVLWGCHHQSQMDHCSQSVFFNVALVLLSFSVESYSKGNFEFTRWRRFWWKVRTVLLPASGHTLHDGHLLPRALDCWLFSAAILRHLSFPIFQHSFVVCHSLSVGRPNSRSTGRQGWRPNNR